MYLIDFFKSLGSKSKIGILIWMIINASIVTFVFGYMVYSSTAGSIPEWACYVIGFLSYIASLAVSLSPFGEWILRRQQGCKKITDPSIINRLEPLFREVHSKAINATPNLNRNIQFYMSDDESPNAFATGRNTVCITKGLLQFSDEEIKGTLSHEFGHLAHKDTDAILIVAVGNFIVSAMFLIYRAIVGLFIGIFKIIGYINDSWVTVIISALTKILIDFILGVAMWLWTKIGVLLCMASSRKNEYEADEYAYNLGYGASLCSVLSKLGGGESKGLWAALNSSHPDTSSRIAKLNSYSTNNYASLASSPVNSSLPEYQSGSTDSSTDNTDTSIFF